MNTNETKWVAVTRSVGGTELFFTALRWDLETSPYACHAKVYDTEAEALAATARKADKYTARAFPELARLQYEAERTRKIFAREGDWVALINECRAEKGLGSL